MSGVDAGKAGAEPAIICRVSPKLCRAADVCASTGLQLYVLRSWEKEFPGIGVQASSDSVRLYRESDVEQVLRIKELVFGEGLTLAGARRRLESSSPGDENVTEAAEMAEVLDTLGADARERIGSVRSGLRAILEVLSRNLAAGEGVEAPVAFQDARSPSVVSRRRSVRGKAGRGGAASSKRATATKRVSKRG